MAEVLRNDAAPAVTDREPEKVRAMFGSIAPRYDLANHLLSCGCDFYWRKVAADQVASWQPACALDVATGSGDLALAIQQRLPQTRVVGADFSPEMLERARQKGVRETIAADALNLPFGDGAFDVVTVAFGLRNMADWSAALCEMGRVLRGGGHLLVLDFSLPAGSLRGVYRWYLHHVLPRLAGWVTGKQSAYQYLGATIEEFPSGSEMARLIEANGFRDGSWRPLTGGVVTMYTARK